MNQYWEHKLLPILIFGTITLLFILVVGCANQQLMEQAASANDCSDPALVRSFDFEIREVAIKNGSELEPILWSHRKSGGDYHAVSYHGGSKHEMVAILGKPPALREPSSDWSVSHDAVSTAQLPFPFVLETACPDVTGMSNEGEETLGGRSVTRYSDNPNNSRWDFLIDATGRLIQAEKTDPTPYDNVLHSVQVRFSGFGEPNVIVDPFPSGTPTPTSTPTPAFALARVEAVQATVTPTPTPTSTPIVTPSPTRTPIPIPRISNLIPENRSEIEMRVGETVTLTVNVYDLQYQLDNSLADDVTFDWSSSEAGKFREADINSNDDGLPNDRSVVLTAGNIGYHLVIAQLQPWECVGRCATEIRITIRR